MSYINLLVKSISNFIKSNYSKLYQSYNFKYHTQKYDLNTIIEACYYRS